MLVTIRYCVFDLRRTQTRVTLEARIRLRPSVFAVINNGKKESLPNEEKRKNTIRYRRRRRGSMAEITVIFCEQMCHRRCYKYIMKKLTLKKIVSFINEIISFMLSCTQKKIHYFILLFFIENILKLLFFQEEKNIVYAGKFESGKSVIEMRKLGGTGRRPRWLDRRVNFRIRTK